jgi:hypothetical protein
MSITHAIKGLDPVADASDNATTPASDIVNMKNWHNCLFTVYYGVGTTGTQTWTVEACDDVSASNVSAIPFHYRQTLSGDTPGSITAATATGFSVTAGSSKIVEIEIESQALAASGYGYVRLKQSAEPVNAACLGGILVQLFNPRFAK